MYTSYLRNFVVILRKEYLLVKSKMKSKYQIFCEKYWYINYYFWKMIYGIILSVIIKFYSKYIYFGKCLLFLDSEVIFQNLWLSKIHLYKIFSFSWKSNKHIKLLSYKVLLTIQAIWIYFFGKSEFNIF